MKAWFGDPVFSRNSSGLIIDQHLSQDYVQINVGSNAYIDNGAIYLEEGTRATLNATKFTLGDVDDDNYIWGLRAPNSSGSADSVYKSLSFEKIEGITYLVANESAYGNYQVQVVCASTNGSNAIGNVIINIKGVTYPTSMNIASAKTNDSIRETRRTANNFTFWHEGIISEFYLNTVGEYNATITSVNITLTNASGTNLINNVSYSYFKTDETSMTILDDYLQYRKMSIYNYGLILGNGSVP